MIITKLVCIAYYARLVFDEPTRLAALARLINDQLAGGNTYMKLILFELYKLFSLFWLERRAEHLNFYLLSDNFNS